jgi:hypothetical protein
MERDNTDNESKDWFNFSCSTEVLHLYAGVYAENSSLRMPSVTLSTINSILSSIYDK